MEIPGSCHKRQRRKRQSTTAKREKSQTPKVSTAILTLPNFTYTKFGVCDFSRLVVTDWRLRRWRLWFLALSSAPRNSLLDFFFLLATEVVGTRVDAALASFF